MANMSSGEFMTTSFQDVCPNHNTPMKAQYEFGKRKESMVTVFKGCNCAMNYAIHGGGKTQYFASYAQAKGAACMVKALAANW